MIAIINYGMGNTGSLVNMLRKIGAQSTVTSDPAVIAQASKVIIPGVGHFANGMKQLNALGLIEPLNEAALKRRIPVLGICLGMQLMTKWSEEGDVAGLGWVDAKTTRFRPPADGTKLLVPHMGWNLIKLKPEHPIFADMYEKPRFYFVHSYFVSCENPEDVVATTQYGNSFTSGFAHGNVVGMQFHPEKSHKFGMRLLTNFVEKM